MGQRVPLSKQAKLCQIPVVGPVFTATSFYIQEAMGSYCLKLNRLQMKLGDPQDAALSPREGSSRPEEGCLQGPCAPHPQEADKGSLPGKALEVASGVTVAPMPRVAVMGRTKE